MSSGIGAFNNVNLVAAKIQDIVIYKYGDKDPLSIMPQFVEIDVFQSLFRGIIEAQLVINDPISLHTNYPIVGEEKIVITYQETTDDLNDSRASTSFYNSLVQNDTAHSRTGAEKIPTLKFTVQSCKQMYPDDKARANFYVLNLKSDVFAENMKNNIMKAFNKSYDQSVQDILKDYLKVDSSRVNPGNFEPCKGTVLTVVPNMLPLPTIMMFTQRAVANNTNHYNYMFFETLYGFNFKTLQQLIDDGKKNKNKKSYIYFSNVLRDGNLSSQQQKSITQSTVSSISFDKRYDTTSKVKSGFFENEYFEIDLLNLTVKSTPTQLPTTVHPGSIADQAINTPDYIKYQQSNNSMPGTKSRVRYVTTHGGGDFPGQQNFFADKFGNGVIAMSALSQIRLTIAVPGDTRVIPGDVINLELPEFQGFNNVANDPYASGDYIVTDMKHKITSGMDHVMVLSLARDSFGQLIKTKHNYNTDVTGTN